MKQIYHRYEYWEDYKNGMYSLSESEKLDKCILSAQLLASPQEFKCVLMCILKEWPISTEHNLTNTSQNRRAWLGNAACSYLHKSPMFVTKIAWSLLSEESKDAANEIAEEIIKLYEAEN